MKPISLLEGVSFENKSYTDLEIPKNSIIYCDPPYKGSTPYKDTFDTDLFWNWVRNVSKEGHTVYVSERSAPEDFKCLWSDFLKMGLDVYSKNRKKLFIYDGTN